MSHNIDLPIYTCTHACMHMWATDTYTQCLLYTCMHMWLTDTYTQYFSAIVYSCWLSTKMGVIWAFVAPMLVIILVSI